MNIDAINISISWTNVRDMVKDLLADLPVNDINIKYDNCVIVTGKYVLKIEIPFSIAITSFRLNKGDIVLSLGDIEVYVKVPFFFRDMLINSLIKKLNGSIIYVGNTIVLKKDFISSLLPFEDYTISSIIAQENYIEANLTDIKLKLSSGIPKN